MVKKGKISEFMLNEHGEIFSMLADVLRETNHLNDPKKALEKLQTLRKKQEDHVFGEENAIFILYEKKKTYDTLVEILQQHSEIKGIMEELKEDIENEREANLTAKRLRDLLKKHVNLEDKEFYPKLDKKLTEQEQEEVLKKFDEVILGNIVKAEGKQRI